MLRRFSINFALFSMALDAFSVFVSLWLSAYLRPALNRFGWVEPLSGETLVPLFVYVAFPVLWVLIYASFSIYDGKKYLRVTDELTGLSLAMVLAAVSGAGILYFSYREVSRALFVLFSFFVYFSCIVWRILARIYFRLRKNLPYYIRRVLVVGGGDLGEAVREQIRESQFANFIFVGFVRDGAKVNNSEVNVLGGVEDLRELVRTYKVTDVVIALPHDSYHRLGTLVQDVEDLPVQVRIALDFFDLALYRTTMEDFAGIPMIDLRASAIDDYQRMIKRAFDLFFGLILLAAFSPFIILSAFLVLLDDGFPILFRQRRVGENGRIFEMLKFRTMIKNAEQMQSQVEKQDEHGNLIHKSKEDPRITRVGRFLRRFSLDELPQFFNVIRGDMSLVGPRPELPYLVEKYQPWQRKRFAIPPGITGWWQVNGRSDKPMHLNTEEDLYYLNNYSIFLDIQILIKTVWIVLVGRGAY